MADIELPSSPCSIPRSPSLRPQSPYFGPSRTRARSQGGSRQQSKSSQDTGVGIRRERTLTEEQYVDRIFDHAEKSIVYALYPGENFLKLATFLGGGLRAPNRRTSRPQDVPSYATLYLLQAEESTSSSKTFPSEDLGNVDDLMRIDEELRSRAPGGPANELLFLRGFASPQWLCKVGWYYLVDPEFFRRHLDMSVFSHQQWFSAPSLPSTSSTIVQLRVTTLARWTPGFPNVETARKEAQEGMAMYIQSVSGPELHGDLGESIVRQINLHDEQYFSLEQDISMTFCKSGKGWTVIIWFDSGKDLMRGRREGPWMKLHFEVISTIRNEPNKAIHSGESERRSRQLLERSLKFQQSRALLNLDYERLLDDFENLDDAFYCITPIFKYKATAENQFLNLVDSVLQQSLDKIRFTMTAPSRGTKEAQYFEDLNQYHGHFAYHKEILEKHGRSLADNLRAIKARGGPQWPRGACTGREKVQTVLTTLQEDFEWLEQRAKSLSELCDRAMQDIHNKSTLAEALKSNDQADQVNRLNTLATFISVFYLPLSYTSGFFGMNFSSFGQGDLPLWIYPVVSVPILLVSVLFMLYSPRSVLNRLWERNVRSQSPKRYHTAKDWSLGGQV